MQEALGAPAARPRSQTAPHERPLDGIDIDAFYADIAALRRELEAGLGEEDLAHLEKTERWGRIATAIGLATCWLGPNPVAIIALSLGRSTRWLLMHHCGHRGYDKVPGAPERYTSKAFARGLRRLVDWPDWMTPEAWIYEHNVLHHANTGEEADPDLVERNTEDLRVWYVPKPLRYLIVAALTATWRASYYAPKTYRLYHARGGRGEPTTPLGKARQLLSLAADCYVPYAAMQFVALPALFLPLGPLAAGSALVNSLLADVATNVHTFLVVGPNHSGDDLFRFDSKPASRAEHFVRQVLSSVNYRTGGDVNDYLHLFLNYQIEHHLYPDLPMKKYQQAQARVKEICDRHGVPYVQEGVFTRFGKLVDVIVGNASMRRAEAL